MQAAVLIRKAMLLGLSCLGIASADTITDDVMTFDIQGMREITSISGPLFQVAYTRTFPDVFLTPQTFSGSVSGGPTFTPGAGGAAGIITLNGVTQNVTFSGAGSVGASWIVPVLPPLSTSSTIVPGRVTGNFAVNFPANLANVLFSLTGTETIYFVSDAAGNVAINRISFISSSSADQIIVAPPAGVPEPSSAPLIALGASVILGGLFIHKKHFA